MHRTHHAALPGAQNAFASSTLHVKISAMLSERNSKLAARDKAAFCRPLQSARRMKGTEMRPRRCHHRVVSHQTRPCEIGTQDGENNPQNFLPIARKRAL